MPVQKVQLGKYETPDPGETPFFCLLQDDSLPGQSGEEVRDKSLKR
jgi:hypothetical protein